MANAGLTGKNGSAMLPRMEERESCKCTGLPWTPDECDVVDEALDPVEAWENYRAKFGTARTMASILSRWYRVHPKRPGLEKILSAFLDYQKTDAQSLTLMTRTTVLDTIKLVEEVLQEYQENPDALIRKATEAGWLKP